MISEPNTYRFSYYKIGFSRNVVGVVITDFQMWFQSIWWEQSGWGEHTENPKSLQVFKNKLLYLKYVKLR